MSGLQFKGDGTYPIQNGKEKRGGLTSIADWLRTARFVDADKTKLDSMKRPTLNLNYVAAADLLSAAAVTAGVWLNVGPVNNFNCASNNAFGLLFVRGNIILPNAGSAMIGSRVLIDGSLGVALGGGYSAGATTNMYTNALAGAGPVPIVLPAGSHTVQVQVVSSVSGLAFCRAASQSNYESLSVIYVEFAP